MCIQLHCAVKRAQEASEQESQRVARPKVAAERETGELQPVEEKSSTDVGLRVRRPQFSTL